MCVVIAQTFCQTLELYKRQLTGKEQEPDGDSDDGGARGRAEFNAIVQPGHDVLKRPEDLTEGVRSFVELVVTPGTKPATGRAEHIALLLLLVVVLLLLLLVLLLLLLVLVVV